LALRAAQLDARAMPGSLLKHGKEIQEHEMIQHCMARFVLNTPWRKSNRDGITNL